MSQSVVIQSLVMLTLLAAEAKVCSALAQPPEQAKLCVSGALVRATPPQTATFGKTQIQCASPAVDLCGVDDMREFKGKISWQPNNQWAASIIAPFAAASLDAYEDVYPGPEARTLRLDDGNPAFREGQYGHTGWRRWTSWRRDGRTENPSTGLIYDVYYRDGSADRLDLMIAYRGTVGRRGWVANFSWATQWFHRGQYQQAKEEFAEIVERAAIELAKGRPVAITATGHSLGGGLARHVASHYACTSVVVFNSSFVTNTLRAKFTPPVQAFIYEEGDDLEKLISRNVTNIATNATYRLTVSDIEAKHNMERLAVGATRMALRCPNYTVRCEVPKEAGPILASLFCDRYVKLRYSLGDKAQQDAMLKMREPKAVCPSHEKLPPATAPLE